MPSGVVSVTTAVKVELQHVANRSTDHDQGLIRGVANGKEFGDGMLRQSDGFAG